MKRILPLLLALILLAACGRHKLRPAQIPAILEAAARRALPSPTAPPQGLALAHVEYPD